MNNEWWIYYVYVFFVFVGVYVEGSVLIIVCMSVERYLVIRYFIKVRVFCNVLKVK